MISNFTRSWLVLAASALLVAPLGCVTKGKYSALESERNQLRSDRDQLQTDRDQLEQRLAATEVEVAELRGTYEGLVSELRSELESGQVEIQQLVDGIRLNVSDELLFSSGSAGVNEKGRAVLGRVAERIKGDTSIVSVEGHTDNVRISRSLAGKYATNWELAGARAASVVRQLSEQGVAPARLRAVSRGPFAPVASNDTAEGRAKNRRTEIILRPVPR